ncbi:hypothetical protein LH462_15095 [Laribacter hongkongensis]|uniref:Uncharacterized protein n=1 Tax=Laribacter hongkongensis TaxID=168471 RepID=A0A248LGU8_9NEIS|nr:hypothetical protein [Laribacter hongkongensis]ASJ23852.1 hypothetical protein LHGZ1_1021 [Laribacter hongkongensis]MCG9025416.1 hypothetical protein [Laribacter hongkongensis]MCG9058741.1 hypothetical protein [Laribacter hongkongensis]MCG9086995.1 hypothetical protein [Laribacter hongkongensis]MCG9100367.1 hypothetical protein [Laribacter hongkongensis]
MAKKSQKNSKHVADLINSATLPALSLLAQVDKFAFLGVLDATKPEHQARSELIECIPLVKREDITIADQEAVRLLQLVRFRTEEMLEHAYGEIEFENHPEIGTFDRLADAMTRLIWLRVKAPRIFDQIETIYLTHHFHGHKKFLGFTVRDGDGRDFEWTQEVADKLHEGVGEILGLDEESKKSCEVIHFEMDDGDETAKRRLHYLVVYHPGKMKLLRQMKDRRRDLFLFTPALEATLVYDPAENKVHVLSDKQSTAKRLADRFAAIGFEKPLSKQPVDAVNYELSMFKQAVNLKDAKVNGAVVLDAYISSLSVSLGHTRHSVTLALANSDNVWGVSDLHFGERNPLSSCRSVLEVKLSFVIRLDGEEDARALDITVGQRGSSNLLALPDPRMRRCGEDILTSLGVMKRVQPAKVGADLALFRAEMKLLDLAVDDVDGHLLTALDLPAADLVSKGLLKKKAPGDYITVPVEDEDGQPGFRRLKVNFNSTNTWALDDLTGERYELSEGDLCRYTVDKSYLRERLDQLLKQQLVDVPLTVDEQEPYVLGNYRMGDQCLPVALVSRLWEPKHADKMDTALRQSNLGLTIVLTTSSGLSRRFLGPGIVVSLDTLAQDVNGQVSIDLSRVDGEVRRRQSAAVVTDVPRLIKDDVRSGVLVGPWPDPWTLTKKEWIDVVEVFVNGWESGRRKWTRPQIEAASGVTFRTMAELFRGAPEWLNYFRGADGNDKPRLWELNIGTPDHLDAAQGTDATPAEPQIA